MPRGLFVTGTGTGVGKTVACAALIHRYSEIVHWRYWKPVQTGIEQDDDTAEVRRLAECEAAAGMRLPCPVSPHLAARLSGIHISLDDLKLPSPDEGIRWIVEGAGGALVPLNDTDLMVDLMCSLALPVVIVARSELGTINHSLLTLEALHARKLCVAGVVMVGEPNRENREAIEHYGRVCVLGEMPLFNPLDVATVRRWAVAELDPYGHLQGFLG
jgi:dethiobiotin synthase